MADNNISWSSTPLTTKPTNYGWSEDATVDGKVMYRMFYDNTTEKVYVHDIEDDQYYLLPDGAKHRGYIVAFKLNNLKRPFKSVPVKTI